MKDRIHRRVSGISRIERLEDRRLLAAGALDKSFSDDGKQTIPLTSGRTLDAADVAVQSDGKTVIAGTLRSPGRTDFAVARLNVDGSLDMTFNAGGAEGGGYARTPMGDKGKSNGAAVALQADGKIVVVGTAEVSSGFDEPEFAIARYNANGTLDKSFDSDGKRTIDLGNFSSFTEGYDVAIQPDGKIVAVGMTYRAPDQDFFVIRLNKDGKLDRTFNADGKKFIGFGDDDEAQAVKLDTDGSILVAGHASSTVGLVKLSSSGAMVNEFDSDGKRTFAITGALKTRVSDILLQSNGRVVIAGHFDRVDGSNDWFIARFDRKGKLDPTFGSLGLGYELTNMGGNDISGGITRAPTGTGFFVSGQSGGQAVVKYTENGIVDTTFGTAGKVKTGIGGRARIVTGFGKRITLAGGPLFASARILDTGANVVAAGSFQPNAFEQGVRPSGFIVTRSERLTVPTRVFFSIGGTATIGKFALPGQGNPNDYTLTGMTVPPPIIIGGGNTTPYVDIPAGQTFAGVTLTPVDDTRLEGNETAIFTILPNASYDIGSNEGAKITIFDNDGTLLNTTADAFVRDGDSAGKNFGSALALEVKKASAGFNRLTYLKFDISSISSVNNAKLRLFGRLTAAETGGIATSVFGSPTTNWSESALNFNNKPATTGSALATTTITDTTARFYEWDVSAYLNSQKAAGKTVVTLVLTNLANSSQFVTFNSREAGNGPQLLVG